MAINLALEQLWRERIQDCRQSGLSIKAWCQQNGLKNNTYHYWAKKFEVLEQQHNGDQIFAEMVLQPDNNSEAQEIEPAKGEFTLSFREYSVSIPNSFNPIALAEILRVLQKL